MPAGVVLPVPVHAHRARAHLERLDRCEGLARSSAAVRMMPTRSFMRLLQVGLDGVRVLPALDARTAPARSTGRASTSAVVDLRADGRPAGGVRRRRLSPARLPKTSRSESELPPRRLDPCMPPAHLADGVQPGDGGLRGVRVDLDPAHDVVAGRARPPSARAVMSTSASSLNWWYIDGSRLRMNSGVRREAMSRKTPPCGLPRPALTSALIARATSSRGQQLGRAAVVRLVVVPAVGLLLRVRRLGLEEVRDVVEHEALALGVASGCRRRRAPTPVTRMPRTRRRPDHAGRVELHELHVDQRRPPRAGPGRARRRCTPRSWR